MCMNFLYTVLYQSFNRRQQKGETIENMAYTFKSESAMGDMAYGSKICSIIDGFADYENQFALTCGKIRALFDNPLYETENMENLFPTALRPHRRMGPPFTWTFTAPEPAPPLADSMMRNQKRPHRSSRPISDRPIPWITHADATIWTAQLYSTSA